MLQSDVPHTSGLLNSTETEQDLLGFHLRLKSGCSRWWSQCSLLLETCSRTGNTLGRGIAEASFHHFVDYNWDTDKGAPVRAEERKFLLDYLSAYYGPQRSMGLSSAETERQLAPYK